MCGFAALIRFDDTPADRAAVARMARVIAHRGPDDSGEWFEGPVGLGFRRLSILDLTPAGHQPMESLDRRYVIVFNGEIYNYVELRRELMDLGYRFRSSGDTETLLYAYAQWGADCLPKLNGMWAFLIYDRHKRLLFGARDRFGMKPLYRYQDGRLALFGSEIKAIRASGLYESKINWKTASRFLLRDELERSPDTLYEGIRQVPAGAAFELSRGGHYKEWHYWSLDSIPRYEGSDPAAGFAECFEDAVRLHMRSDVAVGVNLSGGLDSTSIICASARIRSAAGAADPLMAFCYQDPRFDERRYVTDTLHQTGATPVNLAPAPEALWDDLRSMLWHQDEPVHSTPAVIGFQLMRLAAQRGVKVVLNGQGADETIGGYPNYFRDLWYTLLTQGKLHAVWRNIRDHGRVHGGSAARTFIAQLRHAAQTAVAHLPLYRTTRRWAARRRLRVAGASWFDTGLFAHLDEKEVRGGSMDLDGMLRHAVQGSPLPLYLRIEDRNAMAHSVEARLPFLDHRLVSLVFGLAPEWHLRGPWNKYVLREAMRGRIPESVRMRPDKMGFAVSDGALFGGPLRGPLLDLLSSRAARERGIYNLDVIRNDMERQRRGMIDPTPVLFNVAQFELWCALSADDDTMRAAA